ncbi:MAG: hypothetical protein ACYDA1_09325 [Vulcanimicrobiaceae bacterium]
MMNARRWFFLFGIIAIGVVVGARALAFISQQDQIAVTIVINVTPAPLPYNAPTSGIAKARPEIVGTAQQVGIVERVHYRKVGSSAGFDSPNVNIGEKLVAQNQKAVRIEAEVSPNPMGTLLYSDQTLVTLNATGGTTTHFTCPYHVTVHTTKTYWQLKHGLSNDFSGSLFPGGDLANNTYVSAPNPTATPFTVYSDNGGQWAALATSGGTVTYCVDLTLTIPAAVPGGAYSSNAIYTIYY